MSSETRSSDGIGLSEPRQDLAFYKSLFKSSDLPTLVIDTEGNYIDCNAAYLDLMEYRNRISGNKFHWVEVSPTKQPDGRDSFEKANEMIQLALDRGSNRFTWMHQTYKGRSFLSDVRLDLLQYQQKDCIRAVIRDLSAPEEPQDLIIGRSDEVNLGQKQLFNLFEELPGFVYLLAPDYSIRYSNRYFRKQFGNPGDRPCFDMIAGRNSPCEICQTFDVFKTRSSCTWENLNCRDGRDYQVFALPFGVPDGEDLVLEYGVDISDRKKIEEERRLTSSVFESINESMMITDPEHRLIDVNGAFLAETGYSREEVLGRNPRFLKSGYHDASFYKNLKASLESRGHWSGEIWNRSKSGELYAVILTINSVRDDHGITTHYVGSSTNITHLKKSQLNLEKIAYYDVLTDLPNRLLLFDRLDRGMAQSKREQRPMAVCYLDLDGFKQVNDSVGHTRGDRVLIEAADRLVDTVRDEDTVSRVGGDEFVVLLGNLENKSDASPTLERILKELQKVFISEKKVFSLGVSIGVSFFPDNAMEIERLIEQADQAMYAAKSQGKNTICYFDDI